MSILGDKYPDHGRDSGPVQFFSKQLGGESKAALLEFNET
jgi:hypothetical protein